MPTGQVRVTPISLFEAGAQPGLSATGGPIEADGIIKMGVMGTKSQSFSHDPCGTRVYGGAGCETGTERNGLWLGAGIKLSLS
jgi:hypothetical protein